MDFLLPINCMWGMSILLAYLKDCEKSNVNNPSLPESSDALSAVLMLSPICSTSTWISSVSSVFFLWELFFWLLPREERGLLLSLLLLLSPGSLRSSKSSVEDRTEGGDSSLVDCIHLVSLCVSKCVLEKLVVVATVTGAMLNTLVRSFIYLSVCGQMLSTG